MDQTDTVLKAELERLREENQALRKKLATLEQVVSNVGGEVASVDYQGNIEIYSPRAFSLTGYGPGELSSMEEAARLLMPDEGLRQQAMEAWFEDVMKPDPPERIWPIRLKNGETRWTRWKGSVASDRIFIHIRDVSELVKAQEALKEVEHQLSIFFEDVDVGLFMLDGSSPPRFLLANRAMAHIFGVDSPEQLVGRSPQEFHADPEARLEDEAHLRNAPPGFLEVLQPAHDIRCRREDGSERWVSVSARASYDDDGHLKRITGTAQDVTESRLKQERLSRSEQRCSAMFQFNALGMAMMRPDGRFLEVNPRFCRMLGYSQEELLRRTIQEVTHPDDIDESQRLCGDLTTGRQTGVDLVKRYLRKDGQTIWAHATVVCMWNQAGEPMHTIATIEDITVKRRMEEELAGVEKLNSLTLLAGGIAHDFNNILTAILGYIGLACQSPSLDGPTQQRLERAEKATLRARELTEKLLTFARGGDPLRETSSLERPIREALQLSLAGTHCRGEMWLEEGLWEVDYDATQLLQVLNNLLINAQQAMPSGGLVTVSCRNRTVTSGEELALPGGRYVELLVQDQGTGIAEEDLGRIFDPYFSTKSGGTGLGLATVNAIVRKHGGRITVTSCLNEGTQFRVLLPASTSSKGDPHPHPTAR